MHSVFACFEQAKLEGDDVQCCQLFLLASRFDEPDLLSHSLSFCREYAELKKIVRNLQTVDAVCVSMDFQMKAQESLTLIERGISIMREEMKANFALTDSKLNALMGRDVLEHIRLHAQRFCDGLPRRPQVRNFVL